MKNKIVLTSLSSVLLFFVIVQPSFANTRLEDAQQIAEQLITGQSQSERLSLIDNTSISSKNVPESSLLSTSLLSSSGFIVPTYGRFTSDFGGRDIGSGQESHLGVDLANVIGTAVHASAAGVVTHSKYMNGYGNVVILKHTINGKNYATVYAHLSASIVSVGQQVTQGQKVALMGSTGRSTGSHLHFEVHLGEWNGGRTNAVDPRQYIDI